MSNPAITMAERAQQACTWACDTAAWAKTKTSETVTWTGAQISNGFAAYNKYLSIPLEVATIHAKTIDKTVAAYREFSAAGAAWYNATAENGFFHLKGVTDVANLPSALLAPFAKVSKLLEKAVPFQAAIKAGELKTPGKDKVAATYYVEGEEIPQGKKVGKVKTEEQPAVAPEYYSETEEREGVKGTTWGTRGYRFLDLTSALTGAFGKSYDAAVYSAKYLSNTIPVLANVKTAYARVNLQSLFVGSVARSGMATANVYESFADAKSGIDTGREGLKLAENMTLTGMAYGLLNSVDSRVTASLSSAASVFKVMGFHWENKTVSQVHTYVQKFFVSMQEWTSKLMTKTQNA